MKSTVLKAFYDLQDPNRTTYHVGSTYEGTNERIMELEEKGYVKAEKSTEKVVEKAEVKPAEKAKPQPTKRVKKG